MSKLIVYLKGLDLKDRINYINSVIALEQYSGNDRVSKLLDTLDRHFVVR